VKKIVVAILFIMIVSETMAQQLTQYSQTVFNQFALNPAAAGIKRCIDANVSYRFQWAGIKGAPKSGYLSFSSGIKTKNKKYLGVKHGVGGIIERDDIGHFAKTNFNFAYSFQYNFTRELKLAIGVSMGAYIFEFRGNNASTIVSDPSLFGKSSKFYIPDATLGIWMSGRNFYWGATIRNLIRNKWKDIGYNSRMLMHYTLNAGYNARFASDQMSIVPSVLLRIPPKGPLTLEVNALFNYKNLFSVGLLYRTTDAIGAMFRFRFLNYMSISYSFDFVTSKMGPNTAYSHEFGIGFSTCKSKASDPSACPTFE
jgi:type IX secretion system PorP/SprF family membrane protein